MYVQCINWPRMRACVCVCVEINFINEASEKISKFETSSKLKQNLQPIENSSLNYATDFFHFSNFKRES